MPGDDVDDESSRLKSTNNHVGDDLSDPATAETRLRQEAQRLRQRPLAASRGVRDVTADFLAAAGQLRPGELVKDEYFTLFEAVGALEIMDPKMDSGFVPEGDTFEPLFDVCSGLDASEVLWIMDELFRSEMNFQEGYPLSQNLFTSLHIFRLISPDNKPPYYFHHDDPSRLGQKATVEQQLVHIILRAYCIAVIKCVQLTLSTIQSQTYYEEEDFVTYLFGRELLPKIGPHEALKHLVDAMDWLDDSNLDIDMKYALKCRLVMREHMLRSMEGNMKTWDKFRARIAGLDRHHGLAKAVPEVFSEKVQRQLATSTPPRPMPDLSWQDACRRWTQLCDDIIAARTLTSAHIHQSPHALQRATWAFAYRDPAPGTYARAKMQELLTSDESVAGELTHFELMLADIRDFVLAGDEIADPASFQIDTPTESRYEVSRLLEDCMSRMFGEYLNIYRMLCQNRCRMRRTFTQALPLFEQLELEAGSTDERLHKLLPERNWKADSEHTVYPLSHWVKDYKMQIWIWIIQLGFETDLYLPDEFANMYTFLNSFAELRQNRLIGIACNTGIRAETLRSSGDHEHFARAQESEIWLNSLSAECAVTVALGNALSDLFALLEQMGVIDTTTKPFEDRSLRFEARMKPLISTTGDQIARLPALNKIRSMREARSVNSVCTNIGIWTHKARTQLNHLKGMSPTEAKYVGTEDRWKQEIKSLEKVCVATSVASAQLEGTCKKRGRLETKADRSMKDWFEVTIPPPGKRYHDWWVVPQLKEKKSS